MWPSPLWKFGVHANLLFIIKDEPQRSQLLKNPVKPWPRALLQILMVFFLLLSFLRQCAIGACMGRKYCCRGTWLQGANTFMPFMHLGPYAWILGGLGIYDGLLIGIFPCRFSPKTFQSAIIFCGAGGFLWWQWGNSAAIWLQQHPGTFDNSFSYFFTFSAIDTRGLPIRMHRLLFVCWWAKWNLESSSSRIQSKITNCDRQRKNSHQHVSIRLAIRWCWGASRVSMSSGLTDISSSWCHHFSTSIL